MKLTASQLEAIAHREGPCLVLAVPGAGKTTVLLERLHRLIEGGIDPARIASITFSKKQACDMRLRYLATLEERLGKPRQSMPTFSTIHAFCYTILREHARRTGEPLMLIEGHAQHNKYQLVSTFFREHNHRPVTDEELDDFFRIDGYIKNALITYDDYKKRFPDRVPGFESVSAAFQQFKAAHRLIDFDDMLLLTLKLLGDIPDVLDNLRSRFTYLQVDEAQDTSPVQLHIIQKLAAPRNNLMLVADDDQAIYGFRGADPTYLLDFRTRYPDARIITMADNHRSARNIVNLSAGFIQGNHQRFMKIPQTDDTENNRIRIMIAKSLNAQFKRLLSELPNDLEAGSVAILFRNNLSLIGLMHALDRAGYRYAVNADAANFFRHPILSDVISLLEFGQDPCDLTHFSKIYYKLNSFLKKAFIADCRAQNPYASVFDRLRACEGAQNGFYRDKIDFLEHQFTILRREPVDAQIDRLDRHIGYGDYLKEHARDTNTSANTPQRILETLKLIGRGCATPAQFIADLEALRTSALNRPDSDADTPKLILSTVHGSKGLEYDTVWVIDLIQNEFPTVAAIESAKSKRRPACAGCSHPSPSPGISPLMEEERRLFYVAMTRAKHRLKLVGRRSVNGRPCDYSQFIDEVTGRQGKG